MRPVLTLRLAGGALLVLATLVVVLAWLTPDYSFVDHPVDLLALGRVGWVLGAGQALTGLLLVLAAPTAGRALDPERARRAVPVLLALAGAGLVVSGVAAPDAAFGFPAGTPEGVAADPTGSGAVHTVASLVTATTLPAAILVQAARWRRADETRGAAVLAFVVALVTLWATFAYSSTITTDGATSGLWQRVAMVVAWSWLGLQLLRLTSGSAGTRT